RLIQDREITEEESPFYYKSRWERKETLIGGTRDSAKPSATSHFRYITGLRVGGDRICNNGEIKSSTKELADKCLEICGGILWCQIINSKIVEALDLQTDFKTNLMIQESVNESEEMGTCDYRRGYWFNYCQISFALRTRMYLLWEGIRDPSSRQKQDNHSLEKFKKQQEVVEQEEAAPNADMGVGEVIKDKFLCGPFPPDLQLTACFLSWESYHPSIANHTAIAHFGWNLQQFDVKNVFLHGDLEEEIYMEIPLGFYSHNEKGKVCKFKKALYGLKQSSRVWFERFTQSQGDHTLFIKHSLDDNLTLLLVYVDDMIIAGDDEIKK
ncbi:hypothetical protein CR513_25617, partial [Mucuna pruriens]